MPTITPEEVPTALHEYLKKQARTNRRSLTMLCRLRKFTSMDASLIEDLISRNQPFRIETAAGRVFEIPHRDFISFSPKRTSLALFYEENDEEHFAIIPLLTVTSAMMKS